MARHRKSIMDIKQVLQLKQKGYSNRKTASYLGISRNTVNEYVKFFDGLEYDYNQLLSMEDNQLEDLFPKKDTKDKDRYDVLASRFRYFEKEMIKTGCTLQRLWYEYKSQYPCGYGYTQFVTYYRKWSKKVKASGILKHKAGEKLFIDFAGKKLNYVDCNTGECIHVEVFVGILPWSQYTYVKAVHSQKREDVINCINGCLQYIGGVPQAIVSDNLKSGVSKAHRYAPVINKTFKDCGLYYKTIIDPARPYRPCDKALVEGAVQLVYQRIFYELSKHQFFSLRQLNEAITLLVDTYNDYTFENKDTTRRQQFIDIEKDQLQDLPPQPYLIRHYKRGKVQKISHVFLSDDRSYYSVPYQYIGKRVELQFNQNIVEIYYNSKRLASHQKSQGKGVYITNIKHMPSAHQAYSEWSEEYFVKRAEYIGPNTVAYIKRLMHQYNYPEKAYKQAQGILAFKKHYGAGRLENACQRALIYSRSQYHTIETILQKGLDNDPLHNLNDENEHHITEHQNIRGSDYYY